MRRTEYVIMIEKLFKAIDHISNVLHELEANDLELTEEQDHKWYLSTCIAEEIKEKLKGN